jgi:stearoyl-CoA desaturase (delta-9 desaturase)
MHYEVSGAAVQGRNIRFTSLLTMGESWHNNHHAFPGSARLGLFAGEWDPGWWVLMVLRRLGLVWSVRLPAAMPARAELQPCDDTARARPATVVPAVSTREVLRLCWQSDPKAWMEGPAVPVPPWRMQRWLGPHVRFDLQPGTQRLLLHTHAGLVRGLPALCVALATRGLPGRLAAMAMAPAALAFEGLRSSLDMA